VFDASVPWLTRAGVFEEFSSGRMEEKPDELPMPVTSATWSSSMNDFTIPTSLATL
jgi:hypothetical protein